MLETTTMRSLPNQPVRSSIETPEERFEEQRRRDLLVLLEHLADSQEVTVRMILECLYDIGAIEFANHRISCDPLNRTVKSAAKLSKPIFTAAGMYWFKKNCPELVANWLSSQVEFEPLELAEIIEERLSVVEVQPNPNLEARDLIPRAHRDREVQELRSQVQWLAGGLALSIALLGGTTAWLGYNLQLVQTQVRDPAPEVLVRDP